MNILPKTYKCVWELGNRRNAAVAENNFAEEDVQNF